MVTVVCVINILIALILLYVAWQVLQLKQKLARIADTLTAIERSTYAALNVAPQAIKSSQQGINKLRYSNQSLELKLQRVQQILATLGIGRQIWRRSLFKSSESLPYKRKYGNFF